MVNRSVYKMASSLAVVKSMHKQLLGCSVCHERYILPKLLPCFHSFCEACLRGYVPDNSLSMACPVCRHPSILPRDGVTALTDNVFITTVMDAIDSSNICNICHKVRALSKCLDCDVFVCDGCIVEHIPQLSPLSTTTDVLHLQPSPHHQLSPLQQSSSPHYTSLPQHRIIKMCVSNSPTIGVVDSSSMDCSRSPVTRQISCSFHNGGAFDYFCIDCETAICSSCRSLEHLTHPTQRLDSQSSTHRNLLQELMSRAQEEADTLKRKVTQVQNVIDDLQVNYKSVQIKIRESFDVLAKCLLQQKDCLLDELEASFIDKQSRLTDQSDDLEQRLIATSNCRAFTDAALRHATDTELLLVLKEMTSRLSQLHSSQQSPDLPNENSFMAFDDDDFVTASKYLKSLGGIRTASDSIELNTVIVGVTVSDDTSRSSSNSTVLPQRCVVKKPITMTLSTKDSNGNDICFGRSAYEAKVLSSSGDIIGSSSGDVIGQDPVIVLNANSTVDVQYVVSDPGVFRLNVSLFGQPINGSPFTFEACQETSMPFNSSPSLSGACKDPCRPMKVLHSSMPAKLDTSQLTVFSSKNDSPTTAGERRSKIPRTVNLRIRGVKRPPSSPPTQRYATPHKTNTRRQQESQAVIRVGVEGRELGEFVNPQGVFVCGDKILVADSNNNCVQIFSSTSGAFIRRIGRKGCLQGQLTRPTGIVITNAIGSTAGNILVTDYETRFISVYNMEGKYLRRFGMVKLLGPKGMCIDSEGRIIVVDNKGCCVYVYQPDGRLLHKFGTRGYEQNQFSGPHYCAVTPTNDIIVTDFHHNTVKSFSRDGQLKFSFGSAGNTDGLFNGPTGVAVDRNGRIVVADWGNSRIQIFDEAGTFLSCIDTSEDPLYGPQGLTITKDGHVIVSDSGNHCFKIFRNTTLV